MTVIPFSKQPIRSIKVVPHSADGVFCWARYPGDEWTNEIIFYPPMKLPLLLSELKACKERRGLPIVVEERLMPMVAA